MNFANNYKVIFTLLAIATIFSTVAAERVFAKDIQLITNFVYSSEQTGGVSQKGQDGQDGKPGTDGKPGKSGSSVMSTDSGHDTNDASNAGGASVKVNDYQKSQDFSDDLSPVSPVHIATYTEALIQKSSENTNSGSSSLSVMQSLTNTLISLRLMLITYVSILF